MSRRGGDQRRATLSQSNRQRSLLGPGVQIRRQPMGGGKQRGHLRIAIQAAEAQHHADVINFQSRRGGPASKILGPGHKTARCTSRVANSSTSSTLLLHQSRPFPRGVHEHFVDPGDQGVFGQVPFGPGPDDRFALIQQSDDPQPLFLRRGRSSRLMRSNRPSTCRKIGSTACAKRGVMGGLRPEA